MFHEPLDEISAVLRCQVNTFRVLNFHTDISRVSKAQRPLNLGVCAAMTYNVNFNTCGLYERDQNIRQSLDG